MANKRVELKLNDYEVKEIKNLLKGSRLERLGKKITLQKAIIQLLDSAITYQPIAKELIERYETQQ